MATSQNEHMRTHADTFERARRKTEIAAMRIRGIRFIPPLNIMSIHPELSTPIILGERGKHVDLKTAVRRIIGHFL